MRILLARSILAIMALLASLGAVEAAKLDKKGKGLTEAQAFAANNALFVLYHEVAHLLVDQLGLPVLGREEDAADNMATWILLNKHTPAADLALADAAYGWLLSGLKYGRTLDDSDYYDMHSLDRQRSFQIVCLMVGANAGKFGPVANAYKIERMRQETCRLDHEVMDRSFRSVLEPHRGNGQQAKVEIAYHAASGELKASADAFRASGVFEDVAGEIETTYGLRNTVKFQAKRCGEPNAFYDPISVGIIFCYELMQDFIALYTEDLKQPAIANAGGGLGRSGPATPGQRQ